MIVSHYEPSICQVRTFVDVIDPETNRPFPDKELASVDVYKAGKPVGPSW